MKDVYVDLKQYFSLIDSAVVCEGKGAQGIKYANKIFAMFYKGDLILKFSPERVVELIKSGKGIPHAPGTGKPMKDWVAIPHANSKAWVDLATESFKYVNDHINNRGNHVRSPRKPIRVDAV